MSERADLNTSLETSNAALQRELQQRNLDVEAISRELEAFTYSISHDLRTPLRGMIGYLDALRQDVGPALPADAAVYIARATQCAERMQGLIDDLLRLSRIGRQEMHLMATPLRRLLDQAIAELPPAPTPREIDWQIGALPTVTCDPAMMRQVFVNLLSNAVKYTRPRPRAVIEVQAMQRDAETAIVVRDNGVGFDLQHANNLFTPFARFHAAHEFEGNGIGLAVTNRIVRRHGGRMWAESEPDRGAAFYFTLGASR